jgi:hypothetical protein
VAKPNINVNFNLNVTVDHLRDFVTALNELTTLGVAVGVPEEEAPRKHEAGEGGVNNAMLAYVHDKGCPAVGIPARPFMDPGIKNAQDLITKELEGAASDVLDGKSPRSGLVRAGLEAQTGIRNQIRSNIPPPLKPGTLAARRRRGRRGTLTLQDTGQMRNAINFVVLDKETLTQSQQGRLAADKARQGRT